MAPRETNQELAHTIQALMEEARAMVSEALGRDLPAARALEIVLAERIFRTEAKRDPATGAVMVNMCACCDKHWLITRDGPVPVPPELLELHESLGQYVRSEVTKELCRLRPE